jgi:hypothetical protein
MFRDSVRQPCVCEGRTVEYRLIEGAVSERAVFEICFVKVHVSKVEIFDRGSFQLGHSE